LLKDSDSPSAVELQYCRTQLHQYEQKYAELQVMLSVFCRLLNSFVVVINFFQLILWILWNTFWCKDIGIRSSML